MVEKYYKEKRLKDLTIGACAAGLGALIFLIFFPDAYYVALIGWIIGIAFHFFFTSDIIL